MLCSQEVLRCHPENVEPKSSCRARIASFKMFTVKILKEVALPKIVLKLDNTSIEMVVKRNLRIQGP